MNDRSLASAKSRPRPAAYPPLEHPRRRSILAERGGTSGIPRKISSDHIIEGLLWALIIFLPWPFGSVEAWPQCVATCLTAALALCLAWRFLAERRTPVFTWMFAPLALVAAWAAISMIPLPTAFVAALAPRGVQIRTDLLAHLVGAADLSRLPLSFYPHATAHMLRLLLSFAIVFAAVINVCRTRERIIRLLAVIAAAGALLAIEALLQDVSADGKIFWLIPAPVKSTSGPFVNYNNFSQFLNLSIGAGLALLLLSLSAPSSRESSGRPRETVGPQWAGKIIPLVLLGGLAVVLSNSRGGVLALLAGGLTVGMILVLRRSSAVPLKVLAVTALGILLLVLLWGFDSIFQRMATLSDLETASGARWQVFHDVVVFIPNFLFAGIGLGTHEFVYPMFSHLATWRDAQYVENEYLQLVEEMGLIGVVLVAAFPGMLAWNLFAAIRRGRGPLAMAAVGLAFGIVAVACGSVTDFGQRIISVSTLTAIVCGLIVAIRRVEVPAAASHADHETQPASERPRRSKWVPAVSLALVALAVWMVVGSARAAMAEYHWQRAVPLEAALIKKSWQGSDRQFAELVDESRAAAEWDPGNVEYRCWAAIHLWHAEMRPGNWDKLGDIDRRAMIDALITTFHQCEIDCPTYGLAYAMAGQIRYLGLHDEGGADEIHAAYTLAPTHPAVCFIAGRLSAMQGKWDDARDQFQRALALRYGRDEVLGVYLQDVHRPDLAAELFADDWEALTTIARAQQQDGEVDLAGGMQDRADSALQEAAQKPGATVQTLAAMADLLQRQGDFLAAAGYYRRAVDADYGNADLHLALARSLAAMGETTQATREAGICLHMRPENTAAQKLLEELATPRESQ